MDIANITALFASMLILAAVPSLSVFTVVARSLQGGFRHGALAALGIVSGDLIFILIAVYGLTALAGAAEPLFLAVSVLAGAFLLWQGLLLWRVAAGPPSPIERGDTSASSSFLAGLLLTLGDQKAIFFYFGFFPAFVDLREVSDRDVALIIAITVVAVGGVKLAYAALATQARKWLDNTRLRVAGRRTAAALLMVLGLLLILRVIISR